MPEYRVSHVIDVVADSHVQAAEAARAARIRTGTLATVFEVAERLPGATPQRDAPRPAQRQPTGGSTREPGHEGHRAASDGERVTGVADAPWSLAWAAIAARPRW